MAAVKAKGKLVSIVINNEYVKICEITKSGKNVTVHKTVTVPTPEGCYRDGILEEVEILAGTMRAVMSEHRFSANNVVFSISSARLATKEVLIPNVKANKIAKLIEANATEYFPVNMDEYIVQYSVLEKVLVDGQEKIKVMVALIYSVRMFFSYRELFHMESQCLSIQLWTNMVLSMTWLLKSFRMKHFFIQDSMEMRLLSH